MKTKHHTKTAPAPSIRAHTSALICQIVFLACVVAQWGTPPVRADDHSTSHEIHVVAGGLFGGDLTDRGLSNRTPKWNDSLTLGVRYGFNFTPLWGTELSALHTFGKARNVPTGDIDFDVTTLELAAVRHFIIPSSRCIPYVTIGGGHAFAKLDRPILGTHSGQNVTVGDEDGFTAIGGVGVKYRATSTTIVRLDVRYRYFDRLTNSFSTRLNAVEATIGIGWRL